MTARVRGLVVGVVCLGCVFGSRPILPNGDDPSATLDGGLAGGGADAAQRADTGAMTTPHDVVVSLDAGAPADSAAPPWEDAAESQDSSGPADTAPAFDAAPGDVPGADVPDGDAPDGDAPDGDAPADDVPVRDASEGGGGDAGAGPDV